MFDPSFDALRSGLYSARQIGVVQSVHVNVKQFFRIKLQICNINGALMAVPNYQNFAKKNIFEKTLGNANKNFWDNTFS